MANEEFARIKTAIGVMASTFGKRMDADTLLFWATRLEPHAGKKLWAAFAACMDGDDMPTLKYLVNQSRPDHLAPNGYKAPPEMSAADRKKSDHWAIISMLWLHYTRPHAFAMCEDIFARLFGGDPHQALAKAKEIYSKEEIEKLMTARLAEIDRRDEELRRVPA
ncbi:MAG: hypothetical protein V4563_18000 [Pseudomonadota bacterium]